MAKRPPKPGRLRDELLVRPGRFRIESLDPGATFGFTKESAAPVLAEHLDRLAEFQERLWAEHKRRLLVVLQGLNASGKDGVVRKVMTAFHPLGCRVVGFGVPSEVELAHDYLWRVHQVVPGNGEIVIFNGSHYEDVLVVRVAELAPEERWKKRYDQINAFEEQLVAEGTTILKFYLHISPDEQLERFRERIADPTKRWMFKVGDLKVREQWADYMRAYEDALTQCSTEAAPWFAIPADRKWFRDLAIAEILVAELERLDPKYPEPEIPADVVLK
jgi:PPK2 family polyphosphate:nucleotide phosphotransferase